MTPIFIPSKGRVKTASLLAYLKENPYSPTFIVVEPQEKELYEQEYGPWCYYLVLPENNKGISYVRNFIKQYTENNAITHFWMMDDDIKGFYHREGNKMVKDDISVLSHAEEQFRAAGLALAALEYQQIAWSATKDLVKDGYCDVCVWVDNTKTFGMRYRPYVEGKEDRDFAMQMLREQKHTGRTTLYAFAAPANGSNNGGLKETFYDIDGRESVCVARMVETWGDEICVPITKDNGRKDVKIAWAKIASYQPQEKLF